MESKHNILIRTWLFTFNYKSIIIWSILRIFTHLQSISFSEMRMRLKIWLARYRFWCRINFSLYLELVNRQLFHISMLGMQSKQTKRNQLSTLLSVELSEKAINKADAMIWCHVKHLLTHDYCAFCWFDNSRRSISNAYYRYHIPRNWAENMTVSNKWMIIFSICNAWNGSKWILKGVHVCLRANSFPRLNHFIQLVLQISTCPYKATKIFQISFLHFQVFQIEFIISLIETKWCENIGKAITIANCKNINQSIEFTNKDFGSAWPIECEL